MAQILKKTVRTTDIVGRWGGEEFLIICPNISTPDLLIVATHLKENINQHDFGEKLKTITASFGVNILSPAVSLDQFIEGADDALYRAKELGRNRIEQAKYTAREG